MASSDEYQQKQFFQNDILESIKKYSDMCDIIYLRMEAMIFEERRKSHEPQVTNKNQNI